MTREHRLDRFVDHGKTNRNRSEWKRDRKG